MNQYYYIRYYADDSRLSVVAGFIPVEQDVPSHRILSMNGPHDRTTVETFLKSWGRTEDSWIEKAQAN